MPDTFSVVVIDLKSGESHPAFGKPSSTLAAAVKKARGLTDGGLMDGPTNETRVLDEQGRILHRFRKVTHGSLGSRGGSFRARPCEVDENGNPGMTARVLGTPVRPEVADAIVDGMFASARARMAGD